MTRKKHDAESEHEIDYEAPEVSFETPMVEQVEKPVSRKPARNTFDAGWCWCGKRVPGCTGNPTLVRKIDAVSIVYVCPHGRDETSIKPRLFEAAKKAGLVS